MRKNLYDLVMISSCVSCAAWSPSQSGKLQPTQRSTWVSPRRGVAHVASLESALASGCSAHTGSHPQRGTVLRTRGGRCRADEWCARRPRPPVRIGYAWSAMGGTPRLPAPLGREHPESNSLIGQSATAAGRSACDIAVIAPNRTHRFATHRRPGARYCAVRRDRGRRGSLGWRDRERAWSSTGAPHDHRLWPRKRAAIETRRHRRLAPAIATGATWASPGIHRERIPPGIAYRPCAMPAVRPAVWCGTTRTATGGCRPLTSLFRYRRVTGQLACRYRSRIAARSAAPGAAATDLGTALLDRGEASAMCSTDLQSCLATPRAVCSRIFLVAGYGCARAADPARSTAGCLRRRDPARRGDHGRRPRCAPLAHHPAARPAACAGPGAPPGRPASACGRTRPRSWPHRVQVVRSWPRSSSRRRQPAPRPARPADDPPRRFRSDACARRTALAGWP